MFNHTICLAGSPNTGKSTLFNALTKLKQHTGNWTGKTIENAEGYFNYQGHSFKIIDVPGTYSLFGLSEEEIVAREYICFSKPDITIVTSDATSLEKNLTFLFQVLEYNKNVILVINFIDEARKKDISINRLGLIHSLGIPVVFTSAKTQEGLDTLKETVVDMLGNKIIPSPIEIDYGEITKKHRLIKEQLGNINYSDLLALRIIDSNINYLEKFQSFYTPEEYSKILSIKENYQYDEKIREYILKINFDTAKAICNKYIYTKKDPLNKTKKIDKLFTSKIFGSLVMLLFLFFILYLTITFSNYPSSFLLKFFNYIKGHLLDLFTYIKMPAFITGFLINGIYAITTQVIAVMLPPMAIFFPLFTFLEDLGYLPRIAYNLDHSFKKSGCHSKQCLTMCMGLGCNAAGVSATRIIDSKRERLVAILTNTFIPCNGRLPLIFTMSTIFFATFSSNFINNLIPTLIVFTIIIIGIIVTLGISKLLTSTILKGESSTVTLEMPPYRKPNFPMILYRSLIDRTLHILGRAVIIAAPAGAVIWLLANLNINDISIIHHIANILDPFALMLGLNGIILLAFILALPANEIVLPLIIMMYTSSFTFLEIDNTMAIKDILTMNNWTYQTAICMLLFSLLHFPCSTTLISIYKETKSKKWTIIAFLLPTITSICTCALLNLLFHIF